MSTLHKFAALTLFSLVSYVSADGYNWICQNENQYNAGNEMQILVDNKLSTFSCATVGEDDFQDYLTNFGGVSEYCSVLSAEELSAFSSCCSDGIICNGKEYVFPTRILEEEEDELVGSYDLSYDGTDEEDPTPSPTSNPIAEPQEPQEGEETVFVIQASFGVSGYTVATFDDDAQNAFTQSVAELAGVDDTQVEIVNIVALSQTTRSRKLQTAAGIEIQYQILTNDEAFAVEARDLVNTVEVEVIAAAFTDTLVNEFQAELPADFEVVFVNVAEEIEQEVRPVPTTPPVETVVDTTSAAKSVTHIPSYVIVLLSVAVVVFIQ